MVCDRRIKYSLLSRSSCQWLRISLLKSIRTDNGGEYVSHEFINFSDKRGIKRQLLTAPYTPIQNGVAESMNRTIQEKVTSMLSMAGRLTPGFWAEAAITAVHLTNRSPSVPLDN